ncbi:MAG: DUF2877 domain-containing protein [Candidatus Bathyarchaeia archaeon]
MASSLQKMLVFNATSIGRAAHEKLKRRFEGRVHSVFRRTFNVFDGEEFINVARSDVYRNPINIVTSIPASIGITSLGIKEGMNAILEEDKLVIGNISIILRNADIWIPKRKVESPLGIKSVRKNLETARFYLSGKIQGRLSLLLYYLEGISTGKVIRITGLIDATRATLGNLCSLVEAIRSRKLNEIPKYVDGAIGLGQGLTPSIDDLLLGFVSASKWLVFSFGGDVELIEEMNRQIIKSTLRTTSLSRQMLKLASLGEVDERVESFYESILTGDELGVESSIDNVLTIGKTSGSDILIGALLGFYCGLNLKLV